MLRDYLPAIVFLLLGAASRCAVRGPQHVLGTAGAEPLQARSPTSAGLPSEVQRGFRFGISFYLVAMLFILFDIEVIFLYPIAVQLRAFGTFALIETIVFVVLLMIAFVYVWRRGALEWK